MLPLWGKEVWAYALNIGAAIGICGCGCSIVCCAGPGDLRSKDEEDTGWAIDMFSC